MLRKLLNFILPIHIGICSILTAQESELNWSVIESPPFMIHYLQPDEKSPSLIKKTLELFYPRLNEELGYIEESPVLLFLCNSEESFHRLGNESIPQWSAGFAVPEQKIIVLKTYMNRNAFVKTTIHELTHILLHGATGNKSIPRWFNEGLAVYYSDEKEFASNSLISKALITNSLIPLGEIDRVLSFHSSKAQLAYQQSYLTVIYIIERYGQTVLKDIIDALASEPTADDAFLSTIGLDLYDFEQEWIRFITNKHRWHFLMDFEYYLWIFILLLFITGFILIRLKNRKTLKQWEQEEDFFEIE